MDGRPPLSARSPYSIKSLKNTRTGTTSSAASSISGEHPVSTSGPGRAFNFEEDMDHEEVSETRSDGEPAAPRFSDLCKYVSDIYEDELDKLATERLIERRIDDPYDRVGYYKYMDRKLGGEPADWDDSDTDFEDPDEEDMQGTAGHVGFHSHTYAEILTRMKEIDVDVDTDPELQKMPQHHASWRDCNKFNGTRIITKKGTTRGPSHNKKSLKSSKKSLKKHALGRHGFGGGGYVVDDHMGGCGSGSERKKIKQERPVYGGVSTSLTMSPGKKPKNSPNKRIKGVKLDDTYEILDDKRLLCKRCLKATFAAPMALRSHLSHCPGTQKLKAQLNLLSRDSSTASMGPLPHMQPMSSASHPGFPHGHPLMPGDPYHPPHHHHDDMPEAEDLVDDGEVLINHDIAFLHPDLGWVTVTVERYSARQHTHHLLLEDGTNWYVRLTKLNAHLDRNYRGEPGDYVIPPRRIRQDSRCYSSGGEGGRNDYFKFQDELLARSKKGLKRYRSDSEDSGSDRMGLGGDYTPSPKKHRHLPQPRICSPQTKAKKGTASCGVDYATDFQCPKCTQYFINKQALGWHTRKGCNGIKPSLQHLMTSANAGLDINEGGGGRIISGPSSTGADLPLHPVSKRHDDDDDEEDDIAGYHNRHKQRKL